MARLAASPPVPSAGMPTPQRAPQPEPRTAPRTEPQTDPMDEVAALRAEVARLRELVGPSEESYEKLRLDVLGARDIAIAAEAELGRLRSRVVALSVEVTRLQRDFEWFRRQVVRRLLGLRNRIPTFEKVISRLARR